MDFTYIDINCDVGEGIGNEDELMPYITSCNIACGAHAGDEKTMSKVIRLAMQWGVKIGAHPSYPDRENFGRASMEMSEDDLKKSVLSQIRNLVSILSNEGGSLHHIKPHGALYNDLAKDKHLSLVFLDAINGFKNKVFLYVPFKSVIEEEALKMGFKVKREAFADRNYNTDLSLVSRKLPDALIHNPKLVLEHLIRLAKERTVRTIDGTERIILADTFCIHGDTPDAMNILDYLSKELPKHQIKLQK